MLFNFEQMAMLYKLEAVEPDNLFSKEQQDELILIMNEVEKLTFTKNPITIIMAIRQYKKLETDFLNKFEQYGGNCQRLQNKIIEFNHSMLGIKKKVEALQK